MGLSADAVMADYAGDLMSSISKERDPEMVRQGFPTMILLMDAMLEGDGGGDPELLRAAAVSYALYAQVFLVPREECRRAAILYEKAKECGLRLLRRHRFYAEAENAPFEEYEKALSKFGKEDVPDIYAAANAWLGSIINQPDSMEALSQIPMAMALMRRSLELDESYAAGGAHLIFGIYYAVQPPGAGRDLDKSRKHFLRAVELAGGNDLLPQVMFAEFYAVPAGDEELFAKTLSEVVERTSKGGGQGPAALSNAIARERALRLIEMKGEMF